MSCAVGSGRLGSDEIRAAALAQARTAMLIADQEPRKIIVVPGRLVNLVL